MTRLLAVLALLFAAFMPAHAEEQDVAAISRSVVRVVLIAAKDGESYYVGHGSGIVVAPDKVLTNAHVVDLLRDEPGLVLGVVPSQGKKSHKGRVVALSPGNDLALVEIKGASLPVATFFAGAVGDGASVTAIGYPGTVDRAERLDTAALVSPLAPVKTSGTISAGRASKDYDTLLHTAPMAQGESGGPLVDGCGRVLGVNNAVSAGDSSQFGFAISNREVASFLRQAGVTFQRTTAACKSIAELDAQEAERARDSQAQQQARTQAQALALEKQANAQRLTRQQQIITARENMIALAAVLLVLAALALVQHMRLRERAPRPALYYGVGGITLMLGAAAAFALRPGFDTSPTLATPIAVQTNAGPGDSPGRKLCRLDPERSRVTVSDSTEVSLEWQGDGCINGTTQYVQDGGGWSRILVPASDPDVAVNSYDPATGIFRTERYLADEGTLERARALRAKAHVKGCTGDARALGNIQAMQREIRALLPARPNERLVYSCAPAPAGESGAKP